MPSKLDEIRKLNQYDNTVRVFKSDEDPRTDEEMAIDDENYFKFWNEQKRKDRRISSDYDYDYEGEY